jgi:hypothetical protein
MIRSSDASRSEIVHAAAKPWILAAVLCVPAVSIPAVGAIAVAQSTSQDSASTQGSASSQGKSADDKKPADGKKTADDKKPTAEAERLVESLGSSDFAQRDRAIEKLRALGERAVPALEDAAKNAKDTEVRWNARRVLREIRDDAASAKTPRAPRADHDDLTITLDDLKSGQALTQGGGAIDIQKLRDEMSKRMEEIVRRQMEQFQQGSNGFAPGMNWLRAPGGISIQSHGTGDSSSEVRIDNGKVKVTVRKKDKDGKEETQSYEAPSIEEFKEKYPEVANEYLGGLQMLGNGGKLAFSLGGIHGAGPHAKAGAKAGANAKDDDEDSDEDIDSAMDFDSNMDSQSSRDSGASHDSQSSHDMQGSMDLLRGLNLGNGTLALPGMAQADIARLVGPDNGERLGVSVRAAGRDLSDFLGIPQGSGFLVGTVEPGSNAEAMGLKVNDLVLSIDGKTIGKDATIREALAGVPAGKALRVEIIRGAEGKKTLQTEKRAGEAVKSDAVKSDAKSRDLKDKDTPASKRAQR